MKDIKPFLITLENLKSFQNPVLSCSEFIASLPFSVDEVTKEFYLNHLLDVEPFKVIQSEDYYYLSQHLFAFMNEYERVTQARLGNLKDQHKAAIKGLEVTP